MHSQLTINNLMLVDNCPVCHQLTQGVDYEVDYDYIDFGYGYPGHREAISAHYTFTPCQHRMYANTSPPAFKVYTYPDTPEGKKEYNAKLCNLLLEANRAGPEAGDDDGLRIRDYGYSPDLPH